MISPPIRVVKPCGVLSPGALTVDSIRTNTLTASASPPTSDVADFKEGAGSAVFVAASNQYYTIPDASLSAGFPLKSGDATKQITICGRFKGTTWTAAGTVVVSKRSNFTSNASFTLLQFSDGSLYLYWHYNTSGGYQSWATGLTCLTGRWYSYALMMDGVNKSAHLIVWDESTNNLVLNWSVTPSNTMYVGTSAFVLV